MERKGSIYLLGGEEKIYASRGMISHPSLNTIPNYGFHFLDRHTSSTLSAKRSYNISWYSYTFFDNAKS